MGYCEGKRDLTVYTPNQYNQSSMSIYVCHEHKRKSYISSKRNVTLNVQEEGQQRSSLENLYNGDLANSSKVSKTPVRPKKLKYRIRAKRNIKL